MIIRHIKATDFNDICRIGLQVDEDARVPYPSMDPNAVMMTMVDRMANPATKLFAVADTGQGIAGLVVGHVDAYPWSFERFGSIEIIAVDRRHKGSLVGARLLRAFEAWSRDKGATMVSLRYASGLNQDRITQMLNRLGYRTVGAELHKEM